MAQARYPHIDAVRRNIGRVVVSRRQIAGRVGQLARQIARDYAGKELTILAVLTGSLVLLADLVRRLPLMMRINVVSICSYPGKAIESQGPQLGASLAEGLTGKNVLIVDDIVDTGDTLRALMEAVTAMNPLTLRTCALLLKNRPDLPQRPEVDFVGFEVGDEFLVGYGLDYDNLYRNLPDICVLKQHMGRTRHCPAAGTAGEDTP